jgi:hypothetical protein
MAHEGSVARVLRSDRADDRHPERTAVGRGACDGFVDLYQDHMVESQPAQGLGRAYNPAMVSLIKIAALAGLAVVTLGVFPDRLRGAIIAVGTCVAAALVLHFVAP